MDLAQVRGKLGPSCVSSTSSARTASSPCTGSVPRASEAEALFSSVLAHGKKTLGRGIKGRGSISSVMDATYQNAKH